MGNLNFVGNPKNQRNIPERILFKIKHEKSRNYYMNRIPHTLDIILNSKFRNGSKHYGRRFYNKERVVFLS